MRIVIDARAYFQRTGIARYTRGLVHALTASAPGHEFIVLISNHHRPEEIALPPNARAVVSSAEWLAGDRERQVIEAEARYWNADLFHAIFPPMGLREIPSVLTVFDVTPLTHPELHQPIVRDAFSRAWESLDVTRPRIVATSRATRDAILAAGSPDPVPAVIGIGLSSPFDAPPIEEERADRRGVLFVGTLEPRKNAALVVDAATRLHERGIDVPVTFAGKAGWGDQAWQERLRDLRHVSVRGFVTDGELLELYRQAAILVCPSTVEGFGLPVLEAMAQGALPLVARTPALEELVGDPRLAVDLDADAFATAIEWWLSHPVERAETIARLRERAAEFTWSAVADEWLGLYRGLGPSDDNHDMTPEADGRLPQLRLALFGASMMGRACLEELRAQDIRVECFLDNDPAKWGTYVAGLEIRQPSAGVLADLDLIWLTSLYADQIEDQLEGLGAAAKAMRTRREVVAKMGPEAVAARPAAATASTAAAGEGRAREVAIVIADEGWILERCAREIEARLPYVRVVTTPVDDAKLTYYVNYTARRSRVSPIEAAFFTHVEERAPAMVNRFFETGRDVDVAVAMSERYARALRENGARDVRVITPGVDLDRFQPKVRIGVAGRTYHTGRKGEDLVQAVIDEPHIDWHFTGPGWPRPGRKLTDAELPEFYRSMDYILVPAHYEGGPMSVLEALACGVEVIAPDVGFVEDYPHIEFEAGNAEDLRRVLREVVEARLQRRRSVEHRSWDAWADAHDRLFRELLATLPAPAAADVQETPCQGAPTVISARSGPRPRVLLALHAPETVLASGGPSVRVPKMREALRAHGIDADLASEELPDPSGYDLVHVFNVWEPAAAKRQMTHLRSFGVPVVFSPITLDLSESQWAGHAILPLLKSGRPTEQIDRELEQLLAMPLDLRRGLGGAVSDFWRTWPGKVRELTGLADHLIVLSNHELGVLQRMGALNTPYSLVHNGVDPSWSRGASPDAFAAHLGIRDYALCVGTVEPRKNQLMLARALRGTGIDLVLIGGTPVSDYAWLIRKWGGSHVHLAGRLSHDNPLLASAYAGARLFVLPSWAEGAPLAALEAASFGLPLALSDRSSEREYFGPLATYFDPSREDEIRARVKDAWTAGAIDRDARHARVRDWSARGLTWDHAARQTASAYIEVLNGRAAGRFVGPPACTLGPSVRTAALPGGERADARGEPFETHILESLIGEGTTVIEAGANGSWHTLPLAPAIGPRGGLDAVSLDEWLGDHSGTVALIKLDAGADAGTLEVMRRTLARHPETWLMATFAPGTSWGAESEARECLDRLHALGRSVLYIDEAHRRLLPADEERFAGAVTEAPDRHISLLIVPRGWPGLSGWPFRATADHSHSLSSTVSMADQTSRTARPCVLLIAPANAARSADPVGDLRLLRDALAKHGVDADVAASAPADANGYDLVHVIGTGDRAELARQLASASAMACPRVLSPLALGAGGHGRHEAIRELTALADHLVVFSERELEELHRAGALTRPYSLVHFGIDPEWAREATGDAFAGASGARSYALCAGMTPARAKRLERALAGTEIDLVLLAGSEDALEDGEAARGLDPSGSRMRVLDGPVLDHPLVASAYAGARIFIEASRNTAPPVAALRAAAAGLPLIVDEQSCAREYVGSLASTCDTGDDDAVRARLLAVWGDESAAARETRREAARAWIERALTWDHAAREMARAYARVLEARTGDGRARFVRPEPRKLEIGSGMKPQPGYEHLDARADLPDIDHVADIRAVLPFPDGTFDEVLSNSCIEHVSWRDVQRVVGEWGRIVKPGGTIDIWTPDFEYLCRRYLARKDDRRLDTSLAADAGGCLGGYDESAWAIIKMFGGQDYPENFHGAVLDEEVLTRILEHAGFEQIERRAPYWGLHLVARRTPAFARTPAAAVASERPVRMDEITSSLRWDAPLFNYGGYASLTRHAVRALVADGVPVQVATRDDDPRVRDESLTSREAWIWQRALRRRVRGGVHVSCYTPANSRGASVFDQRRAENPGFQAYVGLSMFETDRLPDGWAQACAALDEVWVPSRHSRDLFEQAGVPAKRLRVLPLGIDADRYDPERVEPLPIPGRRGFMFLSVFDWTPRKGWDVLIEAYARAFRAFDDVCLVLRTASRSPADRPNDAIDALFDRLGVPTAERPTVIVLDAPVSEDDMPRLYRAADAFVLPTRGEGWGLPLMEAMASGLATIATAWGGHLDFMNAGNSWLIDVEALVPVSDAQARRSPFYAGGHKWAQPSIDHTARLMRLAFDDPARARRLGQAARDEIGTSWTPRRTADWIAGRINHLAPDQDMTMEKARVAESTGRFEEALALYAAAGRDPGWLLPRYNRASLLKRLDRRGEAELLFRELVGKGDISLEVGALFHLGELAFLAGRIGEAHERFTACLARNAHHGAALAWRRRLDQLGEARELFGEVVEKASGPAIGPASSRDPSLTGPR
jgi:glycosyltransferase involved in cell wall biosynthesis